jgi:hypothetical protein
MGGIPAGSERATAVPWGRESPPKSIPQIRAKPTQMGPYGRLTRGNCGTDFDLSI